MDVKLVLGDVFNLQKWGNIKNSGNLPEYLLDIEISKELGVLTRGNMPQDTDLIPNDENIQVDDDFDLDEILDGVTVENITNLHQNMAFSYENITLRDRPRLLAQQGGGGEDDGLLGEDGVVEVDVNDGDTGQDQDPEHNSTYPT